MLIEPVNFAELMSASHNFAGEREFQPRYNEHIIYALLLVLFTNHAHAPTIRCSCKGVLLVGGL